MRSRTEVMKAIGAATQPRTSSREERETAVEALLLVAATSYLAMTGTPYDGDLVSEMAAVAWEHFGNTAEGWSKRN